MHVVDFCHRIAGMRRILLLVLLLSLVVACKPKAIDVKEEVGEQGSGQVVVESDTGDSQAMEGERQKWNAWDLLTINRPMQCTFRSTDMDEQTEGVVYLDGKADPRVRGQFTSMVDGTEYNAEMIRDGNTVYVWSSGENEGMMVTIDPEDKALFGDYSASETSEKSEYTDVDNGEYECSDWSVNESLFVPPSDVDFIDMDVRIQDMMEGALNDSGVSCDACNQLPEGEARNQCRAALGC